MTITGDRTKSKVTMHDETWAHVEVRSRLVPGSGVPQAGEGRSAIIERDLQRLYALYAAHTRILRDTFGSNEQRWLAEAWDSANPHGALAWFPGVLDHAARSYHARVIMPKGVDFDRLIARIGTLDPAQELALVDALERWVLGGSDPKAEPLAR